jgi:hypothetical protein
VSSPRTRTTRACGSSSSATDCGNADSAAHPTSSGKFGNTGEKGYWYTIVGVVKPIREAGVLEDMKPAVYRLHEHCDQIGSLQLGIVVQTAVEPASIIPAVRQAIWSLDKNQPLARIQTMDEIVDRQLSTPSQSTALLSAFALLALLLAALGIYGVLAYTVTARTHEIGIRVALGARRSDILSLILGQGVALTMRARDRRRVRAARLARDGGPGVRRAADRSADVRRRDRRACRRRDRRVLRPGATRAADRSAGRLEVRMTARA